MKIKELRIDNLLRDKVSKTLLRVIELTEENIVTYVIDRNKFPLENGWGLEPIPLTEEWLVKFGFEKVNNRFYNNFKLNSQCSVKWEKEYDEEGWWYSNDESDAYCFRLKNIKFVHQLQNLYFALTGEELTIKKP